MSLFKKIFLLLRISHWSKGIFVFLGVIYSDIPSYWGAALLAALAFCLIASAVYIYNDLRDIEEDKFHPQKSHRPLASGDVSVPFALLMLVICLLLGLSLGFAVSKQLFAILIAYLVINLFYNHWLRRLPLFDVLCIASGFMLRILAGTIGIGLPITWWLTITATLLSLFIALCKRRLEMQLGFKQSHRAVLRKYNPHVLDLLIASTASSCFISYLLYTVYAREELFYFLWTLPFCALGLWRFAHLTLVDGDNDDPLSLFIRDNLSRLNLLCFSTLTIMALLQ
jgi:4-hydroxybenzoate polyprenyltransferase